MFSSNLNLTQSSLEELTKAGLLTEVTQQSDGSEFIVNQETGEPERVETAVKNDNMGDGDQKQQIPFLDTDSPWHKAIPINQTTTRDDDDSHDEAKDAMQQKRYFTRAAFANDAAQRNNQDTNNETNDNINNKAAAAAASDPIDLLTVKKLKEILRSQGLKVSGNKKELQDRLRQQVNSLLQGKQPQQEQ